MGEISKETLTKAIEWLSKNWEGEHHTNAYYAWKLLQVFPTHSLHHLRKVVAEARKQPIKSQTQPNFAPIFPDPIAKNDKLFNLPDGDYEVRTPYYISGEHKILMLADIHLPYHHLKSLMMAVEYGDERECDIIILNGDILDIYQLSRWDKTPNKKTLLDELELGRNFLYGLKNKFHKAKVIYVEGNHEDRFNRYLYAKAPELKGLKGLDLQSNLELSDLGIDWISMQMIKAGNLNIFHGHEIKASGLHAAYSIVNKTFSNLAIGHLHRTQNYIKRGIDKTYGGYVVGCLCDLAPDYHAFANNWNHGFALIDLYHDGNFDFHNKIIENGKIY